MHRLAWGGKEGENEDIFNRTPLGQDSGGEPDRGTNLRLRKDAGDQHR